MTDRRTLVVTGASGALGQRACRQLAQDGHAVVPICLNPAGLAGIHSFDLRAPAPEWMRLFAGADAVLHLAGNPSPRIAWPEAQDNVRITQNVLEAARARDVRRVVFASSNWVMGGHRFGRGRIAADTPVHPPNPYAVSKYVGEELGRSFATSGAGEFVALRIGYLPADGRSGPQLFYGAWGQEMWLAPEDFCAASRCALLAPLARNFVVVNVMSRNRGSRWSLDEAQSEIGFTPAHGAEPVVTLAQRAKAAVAAASDALGRRLSRFWMQRRW